MIHAIQFLEDWRCFESGERFDFRPGVNLLVGDQGCGKSSLIGAIQGAGMKKTHGPFSDLKTALKCEACKIYTMDFERDNPRTRPDFGNNIDFQVSAMFSSHGEANRLLFNSLKSAANCIVMMDEPDMALSIRSCKVLVRRFKEIADRSSQVIAAVHNMAVIKSFKEVYSLEHRRWMPSTEFIQSHLSCEHCGHQPCGCGG